MHLARHIFIMVSLNYTQWFQENHVQFCDGYLSVLLFRTMEEISRSLSPEAPQQRPCYQDKATTPAPFAAPYKVQPVFGATAPACYAAQFDLVQYASQPAIFYDVAPAQYGAATYPVAQSYYCYTAGRAAQYDASAPYDAPVAPSALSGCQQQGNL